MVKNRHKFDFEEESYGRYSKWNHDSKDLPKIKEFTQKLEAEEDVEFGLILRIKKAKGHLINFCIDHPKFKDSRGNIAAPFKGEDFITSNDFRFFIGDRIWLPLQDKKGEWEITVFIDDVFLLKRVFIIT